MGVSWIQILVVVVLLVLLFGRGRISSLMGDVARGITSFRRGLKEGEGDELPPPPSASPDDTPKKDL